MGQEETIEGKGRVAAGFCLRPEGGLTNKGTAPFKFGAGISSGAASSGAFIFGHESTETARAGLEAPRKDKTGFCLRPEGDLTNKGTTPFKFGAGISPGTGSRAALVFGDESTETARAGLKASGKDNPKAKIDHRK